MQIRELIEDNSSVLTTATRIEVLLMLMYLGCHRCDALFRQFYIDTRRCIKDASWFDICNLIQVCDAAGMCDFALAKDILRRLQSDCDIRDDSSLRHEPLPDAYFMLKAVSMLPNLLSSSSTEQLATFLLALSTDRHFTSSAQNVVVWCKVLETIRAQLSQSAQTALDNCTVTSHAVYSVFELHEVLTSLDVSSVQSSQARKMFDFERYSCMFDHY